MGMLTVEKAPPSHCPPPPPDILCCNTEPQQNRVRYSHSHSVLDMKTSFYENVYKMFLKELGEGFFTFF
jgi:hypothetical protein